MNFVRNVLMNSQKWEPDFSGLKHKKKERIQSIVCFNLIIKEKEKKNAACFVKR